MHQLRKGGLFGLGHRAVEGAVVATEAWPAGWVVRSSAYKLNIVHQRWGDRGVQLEVKSLYVPRFRC